MKLNAAQKAWRPAGHVLGAITGEAVKLPVHVGDTLTEETVLATYLAVTTFDPSLEVKTEAMENGTAAIRIIKPRK